MRTREEVERTIYDIPLYKVEQGQLTVLELLLDIRELLMKEKK